jgi:hypothetical protein
MKYLVTDPCYLLDLDPVNRDSIWHNCMNDMYNGDTGSDKYEDRTNYTGVQKILSEALGVNILRVSDTGYGDWSNTLLSGSKHIKVIKPDFFADAGMMCVVEVNEKLENFLKENDIGAIFESDVPISVSVNDEDRGWYVLKIMDEKGWHELATSEEPEQEDEDEEFYRRWGYYPWEESEQEDDDSYDYEDDDVRC